MEEWRDVVGYEEYFQVSNLGRIFSKRTNKILKQTISKTGYFTCASKIGGRKGISICFKIHRLVAEAFLAPPSKTLIEECSCSVYKIVPVNHKDGNKLNNIHTNLEWCSYRENMLHASKLGLLKPPRDMSYDKNPASLFTYEERLQIYKDIINTKCSGNKKAKELGCSPHVIYGIIKQFKE
jgi:hypothetical protein